MSSCTWETTHVSNLVPLARWWRHTPLHVIYLTTPFCLHLSQMTSEGTMAEEVMHT
jgi:hypothetical protein|eukprot:SAG25_NODE_1098_length_4006_cov_14.152035_5_plen_56_part_00